MTIAELMDRLMAEFAERGFEAKEVINLIEGGVGMFSVWNTDGVAGATRITIARVYRHNGTDVDVTAKLKAYQIISINEECHYAQLKKLGEVRVGVDASDKVIANRISKVLALAAL